MRFVSRTPLAHHIPPWVDAGALFFVTIAAESRGTDVCTREGRARVLLEAARHHHVRHRWFVRLFLIMPDHVHALVAFPAEERLAAAVGDWKRYTNQACGVGWQRYFFDHRIRNDENWETKAEYIRENPVRKGLVTRPEDWPWVMDT